MAALLSDRIIRDGMLAVVRTTRYGHGYHGDRTAADLIYHVLGERKLLPGPLLESLRDHEVDDTTYALAVEWVPWDARWRVDRERGLETIVLVSDEQLAAERRALAAARHDHEPWRDPRFPPRHPGHPDARLSAFSPPPPAPAPILPTSVVRDGCVAVVLVRDGDDDDEGERCPVAWRTEYALARHALGEEPLRPGYLLDRVGGRTLAVQWVPTDQEWYVREGRAGEELLVGTSEERDGRVVLWGQVAVVLSDAPFDCPVPRTHPPLVWHAMGKAPPPPGVDGGRQLRVEWVPAGELFYVVPSVYDDRDYYSPEELILENEMERA